MQEGSSPARSSKGSGTAETPSAQRKAECHGPPRLNEWLCRSQRRVQALSVSVGLKRSGL
eukprot:scaffold1200_cov383-Prasinococcus_capsulatus_cf.AAC.3